MSGAEMKHKFGLFIHWGIYALTGWQEQYRMRMHVPRGEYEALARSFCPSAFDADEWALTAARAGMEYVCFTAKHHDGFCMFDTKYTDFNVMNTPFRRDPLRELSDACARHGLALSVYYSLPDWHHPNAYNEKSTHQIYDPDGQPDAEKYMRFVKNQIGELLTNYGKIYTLFWDIPPGITDPSMNEYARSLQPDIMINDRGYDSGDFSTPERGVPESGRFTRPTEACQSLGAQSWGWRENEDYFTAKFICDSIDRVRVMGGSYLLNIGPRPDGALDDVPAARLGAVGRWYNAVRESFDGAESVSGYGVPATAKGNAVYLHLTGAQNTCGLTLHTPVSPVRVTLLNDGRPLAFERVPMPSDYRANSPDPPAPALHIRDIPLEQLADETPVIKLEL